MLVSEMRRKFQLRAQGLANSLTDDEIDAYLSRAYQWVIPSRVAGMLSDRVWNFSTVQGFADYAFPEELYTPRRMCRLNQATNLVVYTQYETWASRNDLASTVEGRPHSVLFRGRFATFYPRPDSGYFMTIPGRFFPPTGLDATGTNGLADVENDVHALACISGALLEWADDYTLDQIEAAQTPKFKSLIAELMGQGNALLRDPVLGGHF